MDADTVALGVSQLTNLTEKPEFATTKDRLREQLQTYLREQDDPRQRGESPWDDDMFMEKIWQNPAGNGNAGGPCHADGPL